MPKRPTNANGTLDSGAAFRVHWSCWRALGQIPPDRGPQWQHVGYLLYSLFLHLAVSVWFPLHIILVIFLPDTDRDMASVLSYLQICFTTSLCSAKTFMLWRKQPEVRQLMGILRELDARISAPNEMAYQRQRLRFARRFVSSVEVLAVIVLLSSEVVTMFANMRGARKLMYPAYYPFEMKRSTVGYVAAQLYQFVAGGVLLAQNVANDTFGAVALLMLSAHVRLLSMRVANIGRAAGGLHNEQAKDELHRCLQDHRLLLQYAEIIEQMISVPIFCQTVLAGASICIAIVLLVFYVENAFQFVYYSIFLISMPVEIYPCCYYGTVMEAEFERFSYALFSCNWVAQDRRFRQDLRIFTEQSLKRQSCKAAGMVDINLNTFISVCKMSYSLYAVAMQMR